MTSESSAVTAITVDSSELQVRAGRAASASYADAVVTDVRPLSGGLSSLTFSALMKLPDRQQQIVLKVAPPGMAPVRNRDVLRQARILTSLSTVMDVHVPAVLFEDKGDPPTVPPLFGMTFVDGESFEPVADERDELPGPDVLRARGLAAARTLGALHAVDPTSIRLEDEPEVSLQEEVARWESALETVPDELRPGYKAVASALRASLPSDEPSVVSHGDWRLGNMLCVGTDIAAVIDWEIWSRADPRIDLAWFLAVTRADGNPVAVRSDPPGLPSTDELLHVYEERTGRVVRDLPWFEALIDFKQAAVLALIVKHNRRRRDADPAAEIHARHTPELLTQARRRLIAGPLS